MMNCIKNSVLRHVRLKASIDNYTIAGKGKALKQLNQMMCTSTVNNPDQIMDRVIGLVKNFNRIDAAKVTEKADFQKDLSLDSLDRVELVMALEQEFSIEIPEEKVDKLTCCADVAEYLASAVEERAQESS